jgi:hypothetical protein
VKDFGLIFLSSGRTPYLKATIGSILKSEIDLGEFEIDHPVQDREKYHGYFLSWY